MSEQQLQDSIILPNTKKRTPISIISTSIRKQTSYYQALRGVRSQTKQLNIHVKTLNKKFFKKSFLTNEISKKQRKVVEAYKKMKPNFEATQYLSTQLQDHTKQKCRQYYHSAEILKDILLSQRMFMNNKLIMIKFMNKMAKSLDEPNICWKAQYFHKNKNKQQKKAQKISEQLESEVKAINMNIQPNMQTHLNNIQQNYLSNQHNQQNMVYPILYNNHHPNLANQQVPKQQNVEITPNKIKTQRQYPINFIFNHQYGLIGHSHPFYENFLQNQSITYGFPSNISNNQLKEQYNLSNMRDYYEKKQQQK